VKPRNFVSAIDTAMPLNTKGTAITPKLSASRPMPDQLAVPVNGIWM
jgi:hypothetical protein